MKGKEKTEEISLVLLVSGMAKRSLESIKLVRDVCDRYLANYKLAIFDVYRDTTPEKQKVLPVAPVLIGNLPANLITKVKQRASNQGFYLPVIKAHFIQTEEWRGSNNVSGNDTKDKNS